MSITTRDFIRANLDSLESGTILRLWQLETVERLIIVACKILLINHSSFFRQFSDKNTAKKRQNGA